MSLIRTFITSCVVLGGLGLAAMERSAPYHEIRQMAPVMRVVLTRINLSLGGLAAASATAGDP